jgi:hypothetical protein
MSDDEFLTRLAAYLGRSADGIEPETPIFKNDDGSINREKTLALPCSWNFSSKTSSVVRNFPAMRYLRSQSCVCLRVRQRQIADTPSGSPRRVG